MTAFRPGCRSACAAAALLLVAPPATAADWSHVTRAGNGADVAVDLDTMQPKEGWVRVWVRYDYTRVRSEAARGLVLLQEFNCNGKYARIVSSTYYAPDGSVSSRDDRPSDYAPVKPGSVNEGIGKAVCGMASERPAP